MTDTLPFILYVAAWGLFTAWCVRFCWTRGHPVAAVFSVFVPYLSLPYVLVAGSSTRPGGALQNPRGAHGGRWVPTYVDLGYRDSTGVPIMNHSFAVATPTDLHFYRCRSELYEAERSSDPFLYEERYIGRLPIASIRQVCVVPIAADAVAELRRRGIWKDLVFNQTVGRLLNVSDKSVTMAALVVLDVGDPSRAVLFGVPHSADCIGDSGFVGNLLPESASTALEIGGLVRNYLRCDQPDACAVINAEGVASGLLALMRRSTAEIDYAPPAVVQDFENVTRATAGSIR